MCKVDDEVEKRSICAGVESVFSDEIGQRPRLMGNSLIVAQMATDIRILPESTSREYLLCHLFVLRDVVVLCLQSKLSVPLKRSPASCILHPASSSFLGPDAVLRGGRI